MLEKTNVKTLDKVVVHFSGDSGDGMQLAGNIFTNVSAGLGNSVSTFPDYPADMRPPQGSLSGVSAFQASVGKGVHTPGDQCDVLVAMNPAALKRGYKILKPGGVIIVDIDSFNESGLLKNKFAKKPAVYEANSKVIQAGYDYGHNIHASVSTFRIETEDIRPGVYTDINGNTATAWGFILASEKAGRPLFLGSYPITPATDILHELAKRKDLGVKACQMEDEIAGVCSAIGASFAGNLAVTSTSGPGLALKSEGIGLAVMAELPLVIVDVQRGGPSTGLPTKTEQTDLMQALYGRNGESPLVVVAPVSPTDCFTMAFESSRIAIEHMTPVILLTDAFIGNGSSAWRIPETEDYPEIRVPYVPEDKKAAWRPYHRDPETLSRYWAIPGTEGLQHRLGGLEKDSETGAISTDPVNHEKMVELRQEKIARIANDIPEQEVLCDVDADTLLIGWGGTYGHIYSAAEELNAAGKRVAFTQFRYINPLPKNTAEILSRYKTIIVAELNTGMFADYLQSKFPNLDIRRINKIQGQPFLAQEIVDGVNKIMEG